MDLAFSEEDKAFQREVRDWIAENYDEDLRRQMSQSKNGYLDKAGQVKWQKKLAARGWAATNWPVEFGGTGFTPSQAYIFNMEMSLAGVPTSSPMGLKMVAPVIMAFGTDAQKAQHLPPIINSDIWWCQGYSEPGSGSDLASLQMKAERDGDDYVLNGSKIWTTHAHFANRMFCLVRTSFEGKPQKGITFLLLEMDTPGIEVKPIITLAGEHEVNQVFFDNVRVPVANRLGEENDGWTVAKYLLEFERGGSSAPGLKVSLARLKDMAAAEGGDLGEPLLNDPVFRARLAELEIGLEAIEMTEHRVMTELSSGKNPGPASSMLKTQATEMTQKIDGLAIDTAAYYAFVDQPRAREPGSNETPVGPEHSLVAMPRYLNNRAASIYGGSNEIQRDIMARLVLGL